MYNAAGQFNKDQLVQRFTPLVRRIAHYLMARCPASVQIDDLVQNGMIGLLDAIDRFEAGMGAQFETYAAQRVRGAMLDGLRENDWLPRGLRRDLRQIEQAVARLEQKFGRPPLEDELAKALGVSLADYQKMLQDARGHQLISFEDLIGEDGDFLDRHFADNAGDPSRILEDENLRKQLAREIERLPEREKLMMALYYEQDLNLREIGEVMGVTESRVCQLHSQAVVRLRACLFGDSGAKKKAGKNG
jgi:RNA polymerase sigma factor for flagellar operon FliA